MTRLFKITKIIFLSFVFLQAQQLKIHTQSGVDTYNLTEIDSITFNLTNDTSMQGTLTDIDGNVYQTIKIGEQWWMAENLKVTRYRNGDSIQRISDDNEWANFSDGAYAVYDNDDNYIAIYGLLYNWYAINDNRNIAPEGWRVPTDEDWKILEKYLGMSDADLDKTGWRGTDQGGKLKEAGTEHWDSPNSGATNETGFTARPGGYRNHTNGEFDNLGRYGYWWTASAVTAASSWGRGLDYDLSVVRRFGTDKKEGYAIRLIKE